MSRHTANVGYVLIVDDDADILDAIGMVLEGAGQAASYATDGADALRQLRTSEQLPRLILLDVMMPVMNGLEFRAEQAREPRLAAIPVVLLSGDVNIAAKAKSMGVAGWLRKPVDLDTLLATIGRYFNSSAEPDRV
jgi:two-component system response regulator MprA